MEKKQCPKCGCEEIGKGKAGGYGNILPVGKVFTMGSPVIFDICTNCGHILEMKVTQPYKFKD